MAKKTFFGPAPAGYTGGCPSGRRAGSPNTSRPSRGRCSGSPEAAPDGGGCSCDVKLSLR